MDQRIRDFYLESRIKNSTPGQLLIMLYDGLVEHAESADAELSSPAHDLDPQRASGEVARCINILTELNTCLRHGVEPALCATLSELYLFFTREFSGALDQRNPGRIRGILPMIRDLRSTWVEADRRANQFQAESVAVAA